MASKYQCKNVFASSHSSENLSRMDLLEWINSTLELNVKKVETLCSGTVYCQLMSILFPGCISLKKIKYDATQDHEYISNLKLLQIAFKSVGCNKDIPINGLIKGKFQENFEFLQWFKRFFDVNYDPNSTAVASPSSTQKSNIKGTTFTSRRVENTHPDRSARPLKSLHHPARAAQQEISGMEAEKNQLVHEIDVITKERDFYFDKLRRIEILCNGQDNVDGEDVSEAKTELIAKILEKLYETEEGFISPEEQEDEYCQVND